MRDQDENDINGDDGAELAALQAALRACATALRWDRVAQVDMTGLSAESAALVQVLADEIAASHQRMTEIREAINTIRDGFAMFDPDLRLLHANRSFRGFFGSVIRCDTGVSLLHLVQGVERHHLVDLNGLTRQEWRDQIILNDGNPSIVAFADGRKYRWYGKRDARGNLVCLASDITAEINRQQELAEAQQAAEQAAEAKTKFLTHMSHELRTPLNGVLGMAELLCDNGLRGENQLFAETIRSSAEALLRIINDVLEFTRGQTRGTQIGCQRFDLEWLAADVITLLSPNAAAKGLRLSMTYDPLIPAQFRGDAGRVRQVMMNLLGNGIKYTPSGSVAMQITMQRDQVVLLVEDSGPGIPEDRVDSIFEEFSQLGEPAIAERSGSGLGLAITAQLVQAMGGQLWQTNRPGGGSSFGIGVPLLPDGPAVVRAPGDLAGGELLIVVQPNPGIRRSLRRLLGAAGLRARLVASTAEALASIRDHGRARWIVTFDDNMKEPPELALERLSAVGPDVDIWLAVNALRPSVDPARFGRVLRLPLTRAALEAEIKEALASEPLAPPDPYRRMRVLTADDNATNRLIIEKMLRDCEIDLFAAKDGQEAVAAWREHRPDLILMDISMPVMDGRQASRMIRGIEAREQLPRTNIVAVTADVVEQDGNGAAEAGINDVVVKPVRRAILFELLQRYAPDHVMAPVPDGAA